MSFLNLNLHFCTHFNYKKSDHYVYIYILIYRYIDETNGTDVITSIHINVEKDKDEYK